MSCPFPPCRHSQKALIISLCYPAAVSVSVVSPFATLLLIPAALSLIKSSCLSSYELMVSFFLEFHPTWLACIEMEGKYGEGLAQTGSGGTWRREQSERARVQGCSVFEKYFPAFTRCSRSVFLYVYGVLDS